MGGEPMPVGDVTSRNQLFLQTFGVPSLLRYENGAPAAPIALRRKDLALLIFLCVEGRRVYSRSPLASMLWGDASDERGRHSLTQTLARLRQVLGPEAFELSSDSVIWRDVLRSDARELAANTAGGVGNWPKAAFLADFIVGHGGAEFEIWAEEKRTYYRTLVLQHLELLGRAAEERQAWDEVLGLGQRAIDLDPISEDGHRRVMRAWAAMGERGLALQHFRSLKRWLQSEFDAEPEALTRGLAAELASAAPEPSDGLSARQSRRSSSPRPQAPAWPLARPLGNAAAPREGGQRPTAASVSSYGRYSVAMLVVAILLGATALAPWHWVDADEVSVAPGDGQTVLVHGERHPRLFYEGTFFRFPDWETFMACSGWQPGLIEVLPHLGDGANESVLPSVLEHYVMAGQSLVRAASDSTRLFVVVGCVKAAVPAPALAGFAPSSPVQIVDDSLLARLPTGPALTSPLRRSGTVLRDRDGKRMLWVLFAGGALDVPSLGILASHCRTNVVEVDASELARYRVIDAVKRSDFQCGYVPVPAAWGATAPPAIRGSNPEAWQTESPAGEIGR